MTAPWLASFVKSVLLVSAEADADVHLRAGAGVAAIFGLHVHADHHDGLHGDVKVDHDVSGEAGTVLNWYW